MKSLKQFEEFLRLKVVIKQKADSKRAESLVLESKKKLVFFEKVKDKLGFKELEPNYVIDACYDILIELVRAKMILEGYKTDSHEAEVSYTRILGFEEKQVEFMNELRYLRNGTKYYGTILDLEYAEKVYSFMTEILKKLKK